MILCGYKGVGKSTIGRQLAQKLNWNFVDTDHLICPKESCYALALRIGEAAFRKQEREAILKWRPIGPTVIATGGGSLLDKESRRHLLQWGPCIHLYLNAKMNWQRIREPLPSFLDPKAPWVSFLCHRKQRLTHYRAIADSEVEVGPQTLSRLEALAHGQQ